MKQRLFGLFVFLVLFYAGISQEITLNSVPVDRYRFSKVDKDAAIWSAMYIASNNKIYIGLCTHADAANLYEFDIASGEMRLLANLTVLLGERGNGVWTNGKIHVKMQELDGYVYFGSFCEDNGPPAIDARSYEGPFWFKVNMSTGEVITLSKINSFWGLIGQEMDKERKIIYGLTEEGHLVRYFIDNDYTEDLGRVDDWDICRTLLIDESGNVYGSYAPGNIWKYDPLKERIFDLQYVKIPNTQDSRSMANPMLDRRAQWRYIEWDRKDKVAYGVTGGETVLFKFDVNKGPEGEITPLTRLCAPMYRESDPYYVPSATLAMTINQKDRKIYYMPVISGDFDYGAVQLDVGNSKLSGGDQRMPSLSFLVSYDLTSGELEDIGTMITKDDGSYAYGMGAADSDALGRIWFVGAFEEKDSGYVVNSLSSRHPYSLGLGCYDPSTKVSLNK